jgi:predicted nucleotidyltransferase
MHDRYKQPPAQFIKRKVVPILRKHKVKRAALFPTFANEEAVKHSKLGLVVEFEPGATMFDLVDIKRLVEEVLDRYIDITTYGGLLRRFADHVEKYHTTIL